MNQRVLLIEDEPGIAAALQVRLSISGFATRWARDGLAGVAAAQQDPPDVVLLDVRLPDIDGYEVCRRLKAGASTRGVPVVFLSANVQDEARRRAKEAGAADYLSKPYDAAVLLQTLRRVMSEAQPQLEPT